MRGPDATEKEFEQIFPDLLSEFFSQKEKEKKLKGSFVCPPGLGEWIELANLFPTELIVKIREKLQSLRNEYKDKPYLEAEENFKDWINANLPAKALEEINRFQLFFPRAFDWILEVCEVSEQLRWLNGIVSKDKNFDPKTGTADQVFNWLEGNFIKVRTILKSQANDPRLLIKPYKSPNSFVFLIDNLDIDIRNIRLCKVCGSIFWAKREKQITCSDKCRNAFINRAWRKANRERLNLQRKETYQSKKEQKEAKERKKRNGTL